MLPLDDGKRLQTASCSRCSKVMCNCRNRTSASREYAAFFMSFLYISEPVNTKLMKRVAANDPVALRKLGLRHKLRGEYDQAFEYWTNAAELGDADSHYNLSILYRDGEGVEKDEKKEIYHSEEAAILGHPYAR